MSLEILAMIVAGLSMAFIGLLALAIGRARPGRSMRFGIARPPRLARPRGTRAAHEEPQPASTTSGNAIARRRTLASISRTDPGTPAPLRDAEDPFAAAVIGRLEQTFSLLERGRISPATYAHDVGLIRREVLQRMDEIEKARSSPKNDPDLIARQMQGASGALEVIARCQEWARQQAGTGTSRTAPAPSAEDRRDCPPLAPA